MSEIIVRKQFRSFTWNQLKQITKLIPMKSCLYYIFAISYQFTEKNSKYVCNMFPIQYTFYFDTAKDLGEYIFNIIPKIFTKCKMCKLGYFNISEESLKNDYNGFHTCSNNRKKCYPNCDNQYCYSCTSWLNNISKEITTMSKDMKQTLPVDIWNIIDNQMKSMDFICMHCFENVDISNKVKGSSFYAFNSYGGELHPSGECWICFKRN